MDIGIATHIKSGKQVEFMQFVAGNYENTLSWYDATKMIYGRDDKKTARFFVSHEEAGSISIKTT